MSHGFQEQFRDNNVQRLAAFFLAMRDGHMSLVSHDNPRVVVLSPGPTRPNYLAHSYLARYLGYTHRRGRGPDAARQSALSQDARRAEAYRGSAALARERRLRSPGTSNGLSLRRARPRPCGAGRQHHLRQHARLRPRRERGLDGLPARALPAASRRGPQASVGRDVVVRPARATALRARQSRRTLCQARLRASLGPARAARSAPPLEDGVDRETFIAAHPWPAASIMSPRSR